MHAVKSNIALYKTNGFEGIVVSLFLVYINIYL